jgi:phospholipid/cholesterol/gamma-HCH transport system substrate-binding protein
METRAHHVLIGFFTLGMLLAALAFGIWLVKSGHQQETRRYRVVFNEAVTGLAQGSVVLYNGLRVGEVKQLLLDPNDPRRVLADMEISASTPINQATRARMAIANITGSTNIMLSTDDPGAPPLSQPDQGPPIIQAEPSPIGALLGNGEALLAGVNELVDQGVRLLSPQNIERVSRSIHNLEQLSAELARSRTGVGQTLESLIATAQEAQAALQAATALTQRADRLLQEEGAPMLADGRQAMRSLAQSSAQFERLLGDNAAALDSGLAGVAEIGPVMQDLQRTVGTLNRILSRLEEDPAAYLTGRPPAPEFTP